MTFSSLSSSTASFLISETVVSILAGIGGVIVFIGLWMEGPPSEKGFPNIEEFRRHKAKASRGWKLLICGIASEILLASGIAAWDGWKTWKTVPANQPVNSASASIVINLIYSRDLELALLSNGSGYGNIDCAVFVGIVPRNPIIKSGDFGGLYFVFNSARLIGDDNHTISLYLPDTLPLEYSTQPEGMTKQFVPGLNDLAGGLPAKTVITSLDYVWLKIRGLKDITAKVKGGSIVVTINGLTKTFTIPSGDIYRAVGDWEILPLATNALPRK